MEEFIMDHQHGREEQMTEEELLCRMEELRDRSSKVGKLFYDEEKKKASPEQVSTWKSLVFFLTVIGTSLCAFFV